MEKYQTRNIEFKELIEVNDWKIKVYTIAKHGAFNHPEYYQNVLAALPQWLEMENRFDDSNDRIGFLILHSGTEGVFALINWWVGANMLNTHIFLTTQDKPAAYEKISGNGLSPCVWELEIINHERVSWTNNILKKWPDTDYARYLTDVINKEL